MQFVNWTFFSQEIVINLEKLKANTLFSDRLKRAFQKVKKGEEIFSPLN